MNDSNDIRRAVEVFDRVCDLSPDERLTALVECCQGDMELRRRVEQMLASEEDDRAILAASKHGAGARIISEQITGDASGTHRSAGFAEAPRCIEVDSFGRHVPEPCQAIRTRSVFPGTLAYMSPEQVAGDPRGVDTRCDVYALGVILFQLLVDRLPLDLIGKTVAEAARIIRDEEPESLSAIDRSLRGDVETIVSKALEKDPERRYASAAELAADIRRFQRDEPITARPASAVYNIRKFARRNKGLAAGMAAAFIILIAGLASTGYYLVEARTQRDKALAARDQADRQRKIVETQRDDLQAVQA